MSKRGGLASRWEQFKEFCLLVSNRPNYESYTWGSRQSIAARFLYESFFVARLISPLQVLKAIKRKNAERAMRRGPSDAAPPSQVHPEPELHSTLEIKGRPDFHAIDTEYYQLGVLAFATAFWAVERTLHTAHAGYLADHHGLSILLRIPTWFLLTESMQWTLYYALLRPLMERVKLNLYDEAEYLVVLPIVLLSQVFLLAGLWHHDPVSVGELLLNIPAETRTWAGDWFPPVRDWQKLATVVMGQAYIVIVLASLIRIIPPLHVRKRPNITVIGCGDVVLNRLLPALLRVYRPTQIAVAADVIHQESRAKLKEMGIANIYSANKQSVANKPHSVQAKTAAAIVKWIANHSHFAIIAVPTQHHLTYMLQLSRRSIRFAVEKPLISTEAELEIVRHEAFHSIFEETFVLSYYWLEKALPLNYLLSRNPEYRPLLQLQPEVTPQEIETHVLGLGRLRSLALEFLERPERPERYWTELRVYGGMVLETLIHPLTLVVNMARYTSSGYSEELWKSKPRIQWRKNVARAEFVRKHHENAEISATYACIAGELQDGTQVYLRCGKYLKDETESRYLIATFEHGWITCDMNRMVTRLILREGVEQRTVLTLCNKSGVPGGFVKYQQQVDLVNSFFVDGWGGIRTDDYPSQLDVLRELFQLIRLLPPESEIASDEDAREIAGISSEFMTSPIDSHFGELGG